VNDETRRAVMLEIFRSEIRWYHWIEPEARNIVTWRVRTAEVRKLVEAGVVDIGEAEPGSYSVPSLIIPEGLGSTSPEPGPAEREFCDCESYDPCAGECCGEGNCSCTPGFLLDQIAGPATKDGA
jgi:hypothetical protein